MQSDYANDWICILLACYYRCNGTDGGSGFPGRPGGIGGRGMIGPQGNRGPPGDAGQHLLNKPSYF